MERKPASGRDLVVHVICHLDDTNSHGGLEKQALLLASTLRSRGLSIAILSSTRKWRRAGWTEFAGLPTRLFWTYHSPQLAGRYLPAALIWAGQLLAWLIRHRHRIGVLHIHQLRIHSFVGAVVCRMFGIPTLMKSGVGGPGADIRAIGSRKYFGTAGRRFVSSSNATFVATTGSIAEDLRHYGVAPERVRLIPNGTVMTVDCEPADEDRFKRALFLARMDVDKNPVSLAAAAVRVADEDFRIAFYGQGTEVAGVQSLLAEARNPHVTYEGFVAAPKAVLAHFGWLLLPSDAEGLSNSMIEAMVHGVVPVTTRVSGCVDHVHEGRTGSFFPGTSPAQLEQTLRALRRVTPENWKAMSDAAKTHARAVFDIEAVAGQYQQLYRDLTRGATTSC